VFFGLCQKLQRGFATGVKITPQTGGGRLICIDEKELHPLWLRERSISPQSVQMETKQPLHEHHNIPEDLKVTEAAFEDTMSLRVTFSDGLTSTYMVDRLRNEINTFHSTAIQFDNDDEFPVAITKPGATADAKRIPFSRLFSARKDVQNISSEYIQDEELIALITALFEEGHVIITDVPCYSGAVVDLGRSLTRFSQVRPTNWGDYFNVESKADGDKKDIAYTSLALPPHVDNPYRDPPPCFQLLHTLANNCSGGMSTAVDAFSIVEELQELHPKYFEVLCETSVRWENDGGNRDSGMYSIAPMIELEKNVGGKVSVKQIRYSAKSGGYVPWMPFEESDIFFKARNKFSMMVNEEHRQSHFRLNKGDVWVFNNLRMLHGRTEFEKDGDRHLQGCYVDVDGFQFAYFKALNSCKQTLNKK